MNTRLASFVLLVVALTGVFLYTRVGVPARVEAATPATLNFQARLLNNSGAIATDGVYNVEFKLYDDPTAGSLLWTETRLTSDSANLQASVKNGYLSVYLGDKTAFGAINWDQQLYLTMNIGGTGGTPTWDGEMTPRLRLTAVPYAMQAARAESLAKTITGNLGQILFPASLGQATNYNLIDPGLADVEICLNTGNCAGAGGGITGSGTPNRLAYFNTNGSIANSVLLQGTGTLTLDSGTDLIVDDGNLVVNGNIGVQDYIDFTAAADPGQSTMGTGRFYFDDDDNTFKLSQDGGLFYDICTTGGNCAGSGSGVTATGTSAGYIPVLTGTQQLGNSILFQDDTNDVLEIASGYDVSIEGGDLLVAGSGSFTGNLGVDGALTVDGNTILGDANTDTLTINGTAISVPNDLNIDSNTLFVDAATNRIGIGNAAPASLFSVGSSSQFQVNGTGAIAAATGITSSGTITFSGLSTGLVTANGSGVLSSGTVDRNSSSYFSGTLTVTNGGTGVASFTSNGIVFGNGTGALQVTAAANDSILVTNGSGVPSLSQTLPTAVQGNITSVGTLTSGTIASGFGTITTANNITTSATVEGGILNATTEIQLAGVNINVAGTLSNVAYLDQANDFSAANTFSAAGTALTVTNDAAIDGTATIGTLDVTTNAGIGGNLTVTGTLGITGTSSLVGAVTFGNDAATPTRGQLILNDNTASNAFTLTLQTAGAIGQNTVITLPDPGSGTAIICYQNDTNCGFLSSGSAAGFVALAPNSAQADNSANASIFINDTGGGNLIQLQSGGTDMFVVANNGNTSVAGTFAVTGTSTFTGLSTFNGGVTIEAGDTFTMNSDAFTDLTGSGLVVDGTSLAVDGSSATGFFRNGGNSFGITGVLGTTDTNDLNLITDGQTRVNITSGGSVGIGTTGVPSQLLSVGGTTGNFTVSTAGAVTAVGVNGGTGLIQGTGGLTITGTTNINASGAGATNVGTGTGNTTVGNATGTLTLQGSTLIINAPTLSRTAAGTTTLDLVDAANTTFALTNSSTGVANFTVDGSITAATGLTVTTGGITVSGNSTITGTLSGLTGLASSGNIDFASLNAGGLVKASATTGRLTIATAGTDYETGITFSNGLTRTLNNVTLGGNLSTATILGLNGNSLTFDGSAGDVVISSAGAATLGNGLSVSGTTTINTTGTASTSIGNATGTFALTSSGLNVTTGGAVSGVTTLSTSGIITVGALGTASNDAVICRNASNQLAACNSTFATTTQLLGYVQFAPASAQADASANASIYINDTGGGNLLQLQNNATDRFVVDGSGNVALAGDLRVNGNNISDSTGTTRITLGTTTAITGSLSTTANADIAGTLFVGTGDAFQVSTGGAVTAVGVNSGTGLLQGTGGLTVTGTTNINATGSAATTIGNSSAALTLQGTSLVLNAPIISRTAAGSTTLDLVDTSDTTLALTNSGTGVANLTVDGNGTFSGTLLVSGTTTLDGDLLANGNTTIGNASTDRLTIAAQIAGASPFAFQGATDNGFSTTFAFSDPTANNTITFGDETGIVCTTAVSAACSAVYAAAGGAFVSLQPSTPGTPQAGHININGTAIVGTLNVTNSATIGGDLAVNGGDITSTTSLNVTASNGALTLESIGANNDIVLNSADTIELQDNTNVTGNLDVSGTFTAGTGNAFQIDASGALIAGSITSGFGSIDTGADNITTTGTISGGVITATTGFRNGTMTAGRYLRSDGTNFISSVLAAADINGTIFNTSADTGTGTLTTGETVSVQGGTSGIDTSLAGDVFTVNLDTTEIDTTTFGSGSGFTWTFDAGATDPTIAFASDSLTVTAAVVALSGDLRVNGNDIQDSTGTTRLTLGTTNAITGNLTASGDFDVAGTLTAGTSDAFQVNASGAIIAGSITSGFGSIDTGADNITTTGTLSGGVLNISGNATVSGALNAEGNTTIGDATADRLTVTSQILGQDALAFQGVTDNAFTTTFRITNPTANNIVVFRDEGGTVCFEGSTNCGFATAAANGYVQLAPATVQADSSANASIFINDTGGGNLLQLQNGGNDRFVVDGTGNVTMAGDLRVNGNDIQDSAGTTRITLGATNAITGALTVSTNLDVSGTFTSGTADAFQVNASGALIAGSITNGFGSIDTGADNITTTGTISGGIVTATTGFRNGTMTAGRYLRSDGTNFISAALAASDLSGTIFSTTADAGTGTLTTGETIDILGGANGIDTSLTGDAFTLNLDTTEIGTTTFGSGSGFTWTFDVGVTDPTIAFASDQITVTAANTIFSGDLRVNGNDIADSAGTSRITLGATTTLTNTALTLSGTTTINAAALTTLNTAAVLALSGDLQVTGNDLLDSSSTTRLTLGATNAFNGSLTTSGNLDVAGTLTAGTADAFQVNASGALIAGSITNGFGSIDTGADNITTTGTVSGGIVTATTGFRNGTMAAGRYLRSDGTNFISATLASADLTGTIFSTTADSGTGTLTTGETIDILGGTNGIDTSLTGDAFTLNLDTTEIATTTFGSGSGFTWTFNAGATDPTIAFASDLVTITAADVTLSGDLRVNGNDIADSTGTTRITLGTTNAITGNLTASGTLDVAGTLTAGTADAFQVNASGALIAGSITANFGSIDVGADAISTTGTISGGIIDASTGFRNGTMTAGRYLRSDGTNFISAALAAGDLTGTIFNTNTDSASVNAVTQNDTLLIQGTSTGIDVTHSGDTITVAFDPTEVATTTFGANADFTWTFNAGGTNNPTIAFGDNVLTVTAATNNFTGNVDVSGSLSAGTSNAFNVDTTGAITAVTSITTIGGYTQSGTSTNSFTGATNFTNTANLAFTNATAFRVQNTSGADTMLNVDTTSRGAGGGNLIKIGNSTGADTNVTILQLDSAAADISSNLTVLNGGLYYYDNAGSSSIRAVINGSVRILCDDSGNCAGAGTTLQTAYNNSIASPEIKLDTTRGGLTVQDANTTIGANANLFEILSANAGSTLFQVQGDGDVTTSGDFALNGGDLTSTGALNITPGGALTVGVTGQTALLQGTVTTITSNGATNDIILNSADTIELQDTTNVTGDFTISGNADVAGTFAVGTTDALTIGANGDIVTAGDLALNGGDLTTSGALNITPGGALTIGVVGQTALLQGTTTTITSNGVGNDITLTSADQIILNATGTIELQDNTNVTGNLGVSGTLQVTALSTLNGGLDLTKTLATDSNGTQNVQGIVFTTPADTTGTNVSNGLSISPIISNATGGTNTANVINIADITGDAQVSLNAFNIGTLTGTAANEYALNIGSGWDSVLRVNGTEVINGSGQIVSTQINGTLFSTNTDSASANTIISGDTLLIQGSANGIDITHSGDTITATLDYTEITTATFGTGSGFTWTYDVGAVDPTIAFASDLITLTAANTVLSGDLRVNGDDIQDSTGTTRISLGTTNVVTGNLDVSGDIVAGTGTVIDTGPSFGIAATYDNVLTVGQTFTDLTTAGYYTGINNYIVLDPAANSTSLAIGDLNTVEVAASNSFDVGLLIGSASQVDFQGDGDAGTLVGVNGAVAHDGSGNITNAIGGKFGINNPDGTIDRATVLEVEIIQGTGVTFAEGISLADQSNGTNNVNLVIGAIDLVGNYSIYNNSTYDNYFAGNLGIGDTTPAAALTVGDGDLFQVDGATGSITTAGTLTFSQSSTIGVSSTNGTLTVNSNGTGAISIDSTGAGTVNIGTGSSTAVNVGTGATAKATTIGNTTGTSSVTINTGTGNATGDINIGDNAVASKIIDIGSVDNAATSTVRIATGAAAQTLTLGSTNTTSTTTIQAGSGNIVFNTGQAQFSEVTGTRTLTVQTRTTNVAGTALTVSAGAAGTGASPFSGGLLTLQGGAAGGTGNANGGAVTIAGGAAVGTGTQGLVNLSTSAFTSSAVQTNTITAGFVDTYSTIPVTANTTGVTVSVPDPGQSVIGRVLYITARDGSNDFTLRLNAARTPIDIAMKANSTATLIWNGLNWTAAGASSSTDLQSAYNNTLTSAGGAEIVLNPSGGAADGFTIRNNGTTPITGGILEVQSSIGTNLFSVNNFGTELAVNGGAETSSSFNTDWTTIGSASRTRSTTAGQFVTGLAGVSVTTTAAANDGVRNNLSANPVVSTTYQVSFTAKLASGTFSTLDVRYSRDGGTDLEPCTSYSTQTISTSVWTKITCTITTDGTTATNPDLIIRQTDATARTFYIDNLSFMRNDSSTQPSNVQIGGGINGGQVTLFTLDRSTAPPVANGDTTYLGSMYYDTTTGRIQCYEADGWGACGSAPDNIITLTPEYTGAVLNGTGIGTLTADFCANEATVLVVGTLCSTSEARNFYRWTTPQTTSQSYSIYVNYKLPNTFKEFNDNNTIKLTALSTDITKAFASLELFKKDVSANDIVACGSSTLANSSDDTWQNPSHTGSENSCGFEGGDYIIFKITVTAEDAESIYVENLDFTYTNR